MRFVAIGTGNAMGFVLASRPMGTRKNICFVTRETRCIPRRYRRKVLGFGRKYHLWRLVARIDLMLGAFAVTALATRSALITLHAMLGLVDGEDRRSPILVVAHGALLVAFERSVNLRQGEPWPEEHRKAYTDQKEPGSFAHLFLSYRTEVAAGTSSKISTQARD